MKTTKLILIICIMISRISLFSQTSEDYYNQAKDIDPQSKAEVKKAIDLVNKSLDLDPKYKKALILRAKLYDVSANYKGEITDLSLLIQIDSSAATTYYKARAKAYVMKKDPESAISDYNTAFKKDTSLTECIYERGKIYIELYSGRKSDLAMNDFNYCIAHGSITIKSQAFVGRGRIYEGLEKTDKAMNDYNTAMKINPMNVDVYLYRGLLKVGLGQDGCYDLLKYRQMDGPGAQDYLSRFCQK
jgi:tetratricopeptide (TPR) repeat protein